MSEVVPGVSRTHHGPEGIVTRRDAVPTPVSVVLVVPVTPSTSVPSDPDDPGLFVTPYKHRRIRNSPPTSP